MEMDSLKTTICTRKGSVRTQKQIHRSPSGTPSRSEGHHRSARGAAHLGGQGGGGGVDVAAAVAVADGLRGVVNGVPVVLGHVADARGLRGADGHVVVVALGVHDGGEIVPAASGREVDLTPAGGEGTRLGDGRSGLGEADLGVFLEGNGLAGAGGEREGQGGGLGGDGSAKVGLDAVGAVEGLVPNGDGQRFWRRVDEGVGELLTHGRRDLDHVGGLGVTDVADGADVGAGAGGGLAELGEVVSQADEAFEERREVVPNVTANIGKDAGRAGGSRRSRRGHDLGVDRRRWCSNGGGSG